MASIPMIVDPTANVTLYVDGNQSRDELPTLKAWVDGHRTDEDRVEDGHKLYSVKVLARVDGEAVQDVSLTLRSLPNHDLKDFEPLKLKGTVKISVRGVSAKDSTFVSSRVTLTADGIEENAKA